MPVDEQPSRALRLPVAGEMARHIREFDWQGTELGAIEHWPLSLRAAANILLSCGFPSTLQWGPNAILLYNDPYIPLIGTRHPAALGKPILETFPEIVPMYGPLLERVRAGETIVLEDQLVRYARQGAASEDAWFNLSYSPVRDESGVVAGVLAIGLETTARVLAEAARDREESERAAAEKALALSERYFRALVTATSDFVYRMSPDWVEMRLLLPSGGLTDTDSIDRDWLRHVHPEDQPDVLAAVRQAIATQTIFEVEHRFIQDDGSVGWIFGRAVPVLDADGEICEWFGSASNITAQKRAEAALRESEKLAVVGRLAMSIAHEINNPLEAVTNLLYLANESAVSPNTSHYLELAQAELSRVNQIASETLRFHKQSTRATAANLSEVVESVIALHEGRLRGANVVVQRRYRDHQPLVCFPNEIRQVVANLIGNALDAMLSSSRRILSVCVRDARDPNTGVEGVRLSIADTGSGISRATKRRIFEPFFTTKEATGTGLGLWVSQEIVRKHNGTLHVRSRQGHPSSGTVFAMFLPKQGPLPPPGLNVG